MNQKEALKRVMELVGEEKKLPQLSALDLANIAEENLGNNLQWISDQFDLQIRQKDQEVLRRMHELSEAWKAVVKLQERLKMGTLTVQAVA